LLNAHTLTNDPRYLAKAEELIRRCIHPADDITALNLLDAERRWYYNVFLQVLGRYLWFKSERGQCDTMYGYAQAALLHYARWMADHEYPYLERPEILEYPNETWPAQDLRKSEVFMHAALHAQAQERARFEERARFFFDCSVLTLVSTPSHTLARPTVLALVTGYMRDWFDGRSEFSMPKPRRSVLDFGRPQIFVPQRYRALRRAMVLGAGVVLLVIALVIAIVLSN
jgi:DNA-binding PucR family transcriptional regulator